MVNIFIPTENDIREAKLWMGHIARWESDILPDVENMTIIDFSEYYSEEEKEAIAKSLVPNFTPLPFVLRTHSTVPYKTVCEKIIIGGKNYLSYKNVEDGYRLNPNEQFVKEKAPVISSQLVTYNPSFFPTKF